MALHWLRVKFVQNPEFSSRKLLLELFALTEWVHRVFFHLDVYAILLVGVTHHSPVQCINVFFKNGNMTKKTLISFPPLTLLLIAMLLLLRSFSIKKLQWQWQGLLPSGWVIIIYNDFVIVWNMNFKYLRGC